MDISSVAHHSSTKTGRLLEKVVSPSGLEPETY
jgi:hypothetical protein